MSFHNSPVARQSAAQGHAEKKLDLDQIAATLTDLAKSARSTFCPARNVTYLVLEDNSC
jgi:hypothetical protein